MVFPSVRGLASTRRPARRALLLGSGLLFLLLAIQLMPGPAEPPTAGPARLSAASGASATEAAPAASRDASRYRLFSAGNLLALALLAGGGALALYLRTRPPAAASEGLLQPVGHLQLAPSQQLRLVRCGEDVLLLGVTAGQITLLQRYPASAFAPSAPAPAAGEPSPRFARLLHTLCERPAHA